MGQGSSTCVPSRGRALLEVAEQGRASAVSVMLASDLRLLFFATMTMGNTAWHKAAKAGHLGVLEELSHALAAWEYRHAAGRDTQPPSAVQCQRKRRAARRWQRRTSRNSKEVVRRDSKGDTGSRKKDCSTFDDCRGSNCFSGSKDNSSREDSNVTTGIVNAVNFRGWTPLMLACHSGHHTAVEFLLSKGANPRLRERLHGNTCIHFAAAAGSAECVRLVASWDHSHPARAAQGSRDHSLVNTRNSASLTPLHIAAALGNEKVVHMLLLHGADLHVRSEQFSEYRTWKVHGGDNALHIAAAQGHQEVLRRMLKVHMERSGDLVPSLRQHAVPGRPERDPRTMRNDNGRLPYHIALKNKHLGLLEWLDPAIPVRFLLTGDQLDTGPAIGPARLAVLAASTLHLKLLRDLEDTELNDAIKASRLCNTEYCKEHERGNQDLSVNEDRISSYAQKENAETECLAASKTKRKTSWSFVTHHSTQDGGIGNRPRFLSHDAATMADIVNNLNFTPNDQIHKSSDNVQSLTPTRSDYALANIVDDMGKTGCIVNVSKKTPNILHGPANKILRSVNSMDEAQFCSKDDSLGLIDDESAWPQQRHNGYPPSTKSIKSPLHEYACALCFDNSSNTTISPCNHSICSECAKNLCLRYSMTAALCPYCRKLIAGFSSAS